MSNGLLHGGSVNTSYSSIARFVALTLALSGFTAGVIGCAETLTYSKDSRAHGLELMQQKEYTDAAAAFRNGVKQNPTDYESYFYLGQCYDQTNQRHDAIAAYKTCLLEMSHTLQGRDDVAF